MTTEKEPRKKKKVAPAAEAGAATMGSEEKTEEVEQVGGACRVTAGNRCETHQRPVQRCHKEAEAAAAKA